MANPMTLLYIHCKKGTVLKPGSLVGQHGHRADYVNLPDGEACGVFRAWNAEARKIFEAEPGMTVLPPLHRPLKAHHAEAFKHVDAKEGEIAYDIAERLCEHHQAGWFHPEALDW